MKATESVLELVVESRPARRRRQRSDQLIDIGPYSMPWSAVKRFSGRLGVELHALLSLIGITRRMAFRRETKGYLKPKEADRLLRIGRVLGEATRVFGKESSAAGWLSDPSPMFYDEPPLHFLDSDGGTHAVIQELIRIEHGLFA